MARYEDVIPVLYNGVSQQPETVRLPSQFQEEFNAYPSATEGNDKRPPLEHVARLTGLDLSAYHVHFIDRDENEKYIVFTSNEEIQVFDLLTGELKTVTYSLGTSYLVTDAPKDDIRMMTVGDYTFVVNSNVVVEMDPDVTADQSLPSDGTMALDLIGEDRVQMYDPSAPRRGGMTYRINEPSVPGFKGSRQTLQDLPDEAINGDIYEIIGDSDRPFVSYYVIRKNGAWYETVKPGIENKILDSTMPHALVRMSDGSFSFSPFAYYPRPVGDSDSNKNPSFVGRTIRDVFFYRNRLGFLTGDTVVLSALGEYGMFYRKTILDLLDTAPIDIGSNTTDVVKLEYAVPEEKGLTIFSEKQQFVISSSGAFSPNNVTMDEATSLSIQKKVSPITVGSETYFVTKAGSHTALQEYYLPEDTVSLNATDVTAHVPRYVPKNIRTLTGSGNFNVIFLGSEETPDKIYVYKFYWGNEGKIQSAWNTWVLPAGSSLISCEVIDDVLYVLLKSSDGTYLNRVNLEAGVTIDSLGINVFLDRRCKPKLVYNSALNYTDILFPYEPNNVKVNLVATAGPNAGRIVTDNLLYWVDSYQMRLPGNHESADFIAGEVYDHTFTLSRQFPKDSKGKPQLRGRLILNDMTMYCKNAALFNVKVFPYGQSFGASTDLDVIPSRIETDGNIQIGTSLIGEDISLREGNFRFNVGAPSDKVEIVFSNPSPFSCSFQAIEWTGQHSKQGRET